MAECQTYTCETTGGVGDGVSQEAACEWCSYRRPALRAEEKEAQEDYINRMNIGKHLKKPYREAFIRLPWFNEVARRISKGVWS